MKMFVALTTAVVVMAAAAARAQTPDPKKIEAGQKAYDTYQCKTCHAIKGVGGKLSTDLSSVGTKLTAAEIKTWLTTPAALEAKLPKKPAMPMSTYLKSHKLSDADVDALVAYMASLK